MTTFAVPGRHSTAPPDLGILVALASCGRLHRARRRDAVAVLVHVPDLRPAPDLHGGPAVPPPQSKTPARRQRSGATRPGASSRHRRLPRRQAASPARTESASRPRCRGAGRDRQHRPAVRPRLHPGGLRGHHGDAYVVFVSERVRAARPARIVLPRPRATGPAHLPVHRTSNNSRLHRGQARPALGARRHLPRASGRSRPTCPWWSSPSC